MRKIILGHPRGEMGQVRLVAGGQCSSADPEEGTFCVALRSRLQEGCGQRREGPPAASLVPGSTGCLDGDPRGLPSGAGSELGMESG